MKAFNVSRACSRLLSNEQFLSLRSNRERLEFILTYIKPLQEYREQVFSKTDKYRATHAKSLQKSLTLRREGRHYFRTGDYQTAIYYFTEAILCAPFPSETDHSNELSLAYASRSIAFFQMNKYEKSLFDANHSIELFPTIEMLMNKIYCLKELKKFSEAKRLIEEMIEKAHKNELNLKHVTIDELKELKEFNTHDLHGYVDNDDMESESETSDNFWIHPSVEVKTTRKKGRHFIAKEFIPENTVIIIEKPYNVVLLDRNIMRYCNYCHKKIGSKIWPCQSCNEVVFCDHKCAQEAMDQFHRYECRFSGIISKLGSTIQHVFRMFIKIGPFNAYMSQLSVQTNGFDINEYLEDQRQQTVPEKYKTNLEKETQLKAMTTLLHHNEKYNSYSNALHCFVAIEAAILINYSNALDFHIVDHFDFFISFTDMIIVNMRRILTNVFGWFECPKDKTLDRIHVANCYCFIGSLMNHSCHPNTYWSFVDRKITFKTTRDINPGQEINNTYGPTYLIPFKLRQNRLKDQYHFRCNCSACLEHVKSLSALQCLSCDGPVIYGFKTKKSSCFVCDKDYEDITLAIHKVESNKVLFHRMIANIRNGFNTQMSLSMAEKSLETITQLVYHRSNQLLAVIRKLMNIYVNLGHFSKAIKYSKYFMLSIDVMENKTALDDLLLWTNIYYMHLKEENCSKQDWQTCFGLYSKLIYLLKNLKKRAKNDETMTEEKILVMKQVIQMKKDELEDCQSNLANLSIDA